MTAMFFVAYESDPLAMLALTLLKELGAQVAQLEPEARPNGCVTLLFTIEEGHSVCHGKRYYCCSRERMQKSGIEPPTLGQSAGRFVALKCVPVQRLQANGNRTERMFFQQALMQLEPTLMQKFKKPRKQREHVRKTTEERYAFR